MSAHAASMPPSGGISGGTKVVFAVALVASIIGVILLNNRVTPEGGHQIDPESTENNAENPTDVSTHITDRFQRTFNAAGTTQSASAQTNLGRDEVFESGRSYYQDQRSNRGNDYHASHIIRGGKINPKIKENYPKLYKLLEYMLSHTQIVERYANEWKGLGGSIDEWQEKLLKALQAIDFSGELTKEATKIIQEAKKSYLDILNQYIAKFNKDNQNDKVSKLKKAKANIEKLLIEELFERGQKGHKNTNM